MASSYYFVAVPMKTTIDPNKNPAVTKESQIPAHLVNNCLRDRKAVLKSLLAIREKIAQKKQHDLFHGQETGANLSAKLHEELEKYMVSTLSLQKVAPEYEQFHYFYWGESISQRQNVAFCDVKYDFVNLHFNMGCVEMERAAYAVWAAKDELTMEGAEKTAYGALCSAAGHYALAAELVEKVDCLAPDGHTQNELPLDIRPDFLVFLKLIALAEAQEIGTTKAIKKEENKGKELLPKMCHRTLELYKEALDVGSKKVDCQTEDFSITLNIIKVKCAMWKALTSAYTGATRYDKDLAPEGLWHVKQAAEQMNASRDLVYELNLGKLLIETTDNTAGIVSRMVHRVESMNNLVTREKAGEGPYDLPAPQVLARPKPIALPTDLLPVSLEQPTNSINDGHEDEDGFTHVAKPEEKEGGAKK